MSSARLAASLAAAALVAPAAAGRRPSPYAGVTGLPAPAFNFSQLVDHFSASPLTYNQRYYKNESSFAGPGSPILCILGGEGAIEPATGILYPSIVLLAARLGALVVQPEHRFYGASQPAGPYSTSTLALLTPDQALADAAYFLTAMRDAYGCSGRNGSPRCPVVTIGGSYPGWLSAMMRLRYPAVVDAAYAGSAPMNFYAQAVDPYAYYKVVTDSAGRALPGCPEAWREIVAGTLSSAGATKAALTTNLNLCAPLPAYLASGTDAALAAEVGMVLQYTFADLNMANYPPSTGAAKTALYSACAAAVAGVASPWTTLASFLTTYAAVGPPSACFNLSAQLPSGPGATISSGDWSGVGVGNDGSSWDFETSTLLVEAIGTNGQSDMFYARDWDEQWLVEHAAARFNVVPRPHALVDAWGFSEAMLPNVTSRIVFTNGLNDGWSAGGVLTNLSATLLAFNAPSGAHHSDLSHNWPSAADAPDVVAMQAAAQNAIAGWIAGL